MCRWLAYQGHPIYLDQLIYEPEFSLVHQSLEARKAPTRVNADGFGLGWYTSDRETPGQFHEVLPAWSDENLRSLAHHITSHRFMAHVRASTGTQVSRANCHPFIHHRWMFLHNGQIGEYECLRWGLDRLLPEYLYVQRNGTTDSELIFLLMLSYGLEDTPLMAIQETIHHIEHLRKEKGINTPFKASMCLSDGDSLWVVRYSSDGQPPTVFISYQEQGMVLASEPLDGVHSWVLLPAQSIHHLKSGEQTLTPLSCCPTMC
ncbi:class II glutamine amidotransferase [Vibrio palustris]|uniref:Amidohydrolase EgtC n=1 Tax=Vibrio palustris TaxID=1918946 RepID=A0A1R4B563_9VIBR|nr:class II glutamine amidotransferase [Vibrio palustris]SJL84049.1 Amidohydrolase EgtC [Vibrio palustris]